MLRQVRTNKNKNLVKEPESLKAKFLVTETHKQKRYFKIQHSTTKIVRFSGFNFTMGEETGVPGENPRRWSEGKSL